jgi:hypothetical protein
MKQLQHKEKEKTNE